MVHDGLLFAAGSRQAVNVHGNGGGLARYWKSDEIATLSWRVPATA